MTINHSKTFLSSRDIYNCLLQKYKRETNMEIANQLSENADYNTEWQKQMHANIPL